MKSALTIKLSPSQTCDLKHILRSLKKTRYPFSFHRAGPVRAEVASKNNATPSSPKERHSAIKQRGS